MTINSHHLRVTLVQVNAGRDIQANLGRVKQVLSRIGTTDLIAFPEVFAIRGSDEDFRNSAQPLTGPLMNFMASIAHRHNAWVLVGSFVELNHPAAYNTSVLMDRRGEVVASYRKMHLFEAELDAGQVVRESDLWTPGSEPVMAELDGWRCGMAICYDLRFPELFRQYSSQGAHLFFVPSNFTQRTGKDHWEILLRARAIENQCFVVAPNQCGVNPHTGVASYGNSMIIGPWGDVLARFDEDEKAETVTLDMYDLEKTRRIVPALAHRKL